MAFFVGDRSALPEALIVTEASPVTTGGVSVEYTGAPWRPFPFIPEEEGASDVLAPSNPMIGIVFWPSARPC